MKYDLYSYDENLVLRVPPLLIAAIYWSIHHVFLLALGASSNSGEVFGLVLDYSGSALFLISDMPGALVLFARINRTPEAGVRVRWIWRHGLSLLVFGVSMSAAATSYYYQKEIINLESPGFFLLIADLGIVIYLLFSRRVRDVFADFPQAETVSEERS